MILLIIKYAQWTGRPHLAGLFRGQICVHSWQVFVRLTTLTVDCGLFLYPLGRSGFIYVVFLFLFLLKIDNHLFKRIFLFMQHK